MFAQLSTKKRDRFADVQKVIGKRAALKLREGFAGESIYIPAPTKAARNARIRAERAEGAKIADLMKAYELSRRQIWNILGSTS